MFAQQKQQGYPAHTVPGQVVGETPEQFAAAKQAANSSTGTVSQPVILPSTQTVDTKPVVQTKSTSQYTGGSDNPQEAMDFLASMYTSPQEEERLRKASVQQQRIMAVANALRHLGNVYYASKGATPQTFNDPVAEERKRYLSEKALRDQNNYKYMTYQQAKANQEARMRQAEAQLKFQMAKDARDYELRKKESDARANLREAQMNRYETLRALDEAKRQNLISDKAYKEIRNQYAPAVEQSKIDKNNRTGGGRGGSGSSGGKYWAYDENGNIHYYPNKTMWQQGVESFSSNLPQLETYTNTDIYGNRSTSEKSVPTYKKAAENARKAQGGGAVSKFSINGSKKSDKKGGSNISKFSINGKK